MGILPIIFPFFASILKRVTFYRKEFAPLFLEEWTLFKELQPPEKETRIHSVKLMKTRRLARWGMLQSRGNYLVNYFRITHNCLHLELCFHTVVYGKRNTGAVPKIVPLILEVESQFFLNFYM